MPVICRPLRMARTMVMNCLTAGDKAVDATAGNGRDTVFLARLVGASGKVWAFDIQKCALINTARLLESENLKSHVSLVEDGHEHLTHHVEDNLGAVMFNLGYLPGGDHRVITRPSTTLIALEAALKSLRQGGIVTLIIYSGHPGGKEEEDALLQYAASLEQTKFTVLHYRMLNQINNPPSLLAIEKLALSDIT